ncbi:hypothetical protein B0A54_17582 [Friedmanniomyces endolithicus]|uniref:Uncharacterized protein n=1 Tax=Friedmanniomyces endolithicus TaxID=329885 RepID=A0A4U0TU94_9PEZI|nr:hypothetical protein LTS09_017145 [Friedmanniomyces endolithicus]TKA25794.1 hypothetical protein B0A54_17582 [Friedmanniomyces endolithicus]
MDPYHVVADPPIASSSGTASERDVTSDTPAKEIRHRLGLVTGNVQDDYAWSQFVDHAKAVYSAHSSTLPDLSWTKISPPSREAMVQQVLEHFPRAWEEHTTDKGLPWKVSNWRLALCHMKRRRNRKDTDTAHRTVASASPSGGRTQEADSEGLVLVAYKTGDSTQTFYDPERHLGRDSTITGPYYEVELPLACVLPASIEGFARFDRLDRFARFDRLNCLDRLRPFQPLQGRIV